MIWHTLLITGLLLVSQAPLQGASKASTSLTTTKRQLLQELTVKLPLQTDGTVFVYPTELHDLTTCMQSFETLIKNARTTAECTLISQKLNFAKLLIYHRTTMVGADDAVQSLYTVLIPRILARTQMRSRNDAIISFRS